MSKKKSKNYSVAGDLYVVEVHIFAPSDDPSICSLIKSDKHIVYSENIPSEDTIKQLYQNTFYECVSRGVLLPDVDYQATIDVFKELKSYSCATSYHFGNEKIHVC